MEKIRTLRGFKDLFGEEIDKYRTIEEISRKYLALLGFREVELPVLEKTELFVRSIGDTTDIVEKEMFTFADLGGDSLTLRPEGTAGMVRHYLQEGLYAKEPVARLFTIGPMFRHERPQKGRFREFHQIDVEIFGTESSLADAELIWLIHLILTGLHVSKFTIEVNTVGCKQCRPVFRDVLIRYFESKKSDLCPDCLRRLDKNPLRIFDCKNEKCIESAISSPLLYDHLCESCRSHFEEFLHHTSDYDIPVQLNKRLVRGLDYYTRTVFEITSEELGSQKAFIAGGRYNNLVEEMGGPSVPSIGFAFGVERLMMLVGDVEKHRLPVVFFAYLGERARSHLIPLLKVFGAKGFPVRYAFEDKSLKAQMRMADSLNARFVLILGDDEIDRGVIVLRDMNNRAQHELAFNLETIFSEFENFPGTPEKLLENRQE